MGDLQAENIYKWYFNLIKQGVEEIKLDKEQMNVSQFRYLRKKMVKLIDMLILMGKY